jgi:hypothetical protein
MLLLYTEFSGNVHCTYIIYFPPNLKIIYELKWIYSTYGHQFQMRIYIYFYIFIHIFYNKIIIYTGISLLILASLFVNVFDILQAWQSYESPSDQNQACKMSLNQRGNQNV